MKKTTLLIVLLTLSILLCACGSGDAQVYVYIDDILPEVLHQDVVAGVSQIPGVKSVQYVSAEEALAQFQQEHKDDPAFADVEVGDLRAYVIVTVDSAEASVVAAALEQMEGVASVKVQGDMPFVTRIVVQIGTWLQERVQ